METAGSTYELGVELPVEGNQPRSKLNSWISSSPTQNEGTDTPIAGSRVSRAFAGRHWTHAAA